MSIWSDDSLMLLKYILEKKKIFWRNSDYDLLQTYFQVSAQPKG